MRLAIFILFILSPIAGASAQEEARAITWNSKPDCGYKNGIDVQRNKVKCYSVNTQSGPVSVIENSEVVFSIVLGFDKSNVVVSVSISNLGSEPLEFDGDKWSASHYRSEADALSSKVPVFSEYSIPSRDLAEAIRRGAKQSITLESYMSDLSILPAWAAMTSQTKQRQEAPAIEVNQNDAVRQQAEKRIAAIRKTALTAKYVASGAVIKGLVYFRREKKAPYSVISMPVGDAIYVIHFLHSESEH